MTCKQPPEAISSLEIRPKLENVGLLKWLRKQDPEWHRELSGRKRAELFKNYGNKCLICGSEDNPERKLRAAHIKPKEEGGIYDLSNMVPLCIQRDEEKPLGCRDLYDRGFLARQELKRLIKEKEPNCRIRQRMLEDFASLK